MRGRIEGMDDREPLVLTFIPSLVSLLVRAERQKGSALTESEVIRDAGTCVAIPKSSIAGVIEGRGTGSASQRQA